MYLFMYSDHIPVCIAGGRINRVRLSILLVVSCTGKMNISLENLVSRDGLGSPVPRQPAHLHTQAESGAYGIPPDFRGGVYLFI